VFGLVLGSFLNVVIWRVPRGESLIHPGSACTSCGAPVAARDNVPVLSWMLLLGQARCCGAAISVRYPLVELVTAVFLAGLAVWTGPAWRLLAFAYLAALSIVLAVIDVDVKRLPYWLVAPSYPVGAVLLGIASLGEQDLSGMVRALIGAAALWSFYTVLHLVYPPGMAYGDVRLAGVLGLYLAWLGWDHLVVGAFLGFLVGGLGSAVALALRRVSLKTQIPFGPYMLLGAWLGILFGHGVADAYLRTAGLR